MTMSTESLDREAKSRDQWKKRNRYYHCQIESLCRSIVLKGSSVLDIGCSTGDLLASLEPTTGIGIDASSEAVRLAQDKYPRLKFVHENAESMEHRGSYDYVILSDAVSYFNDVWSAFRKLRQVTTPSTRIIITQYNPLWELIILIAEKCGLKSPQKIQNWLSIDDLEGQLNLNGYEVIQKNYRLLMPVYIPGLSRLVNQFIAPLPLIRKLCLVHSIVARENPILRPTTDSSFTCSVIVPCRNEVGNIARIVDELPPMGRHTQLIFVDGRSTDGTVEAIQEVIAKNKDRKDIELIHQGDGEGKGDAVRKGFAAATGDFLFILDADITVPPDDLPKFYQALAENRGEFINGTRLVYPMEKEAMRWLNLLGNKFFSLMFSWLLDQRIKDTLCGTKVISRQNYLRLAANRSYFGEFDPFGDFDLLFGAAKLSLKIVEVPVRYRARTYGSTKISRFRHGWLLLKMCGVAMTRLKFVWP